MLLNSEILDALIGFQIQDDVDIGTSNLKVLETTLNETVEECKVLKKYNKIGDKIRVLSLVATEKNIDDLQRKLSSVKNTLKILDEQMRPQRSELEETDARVRVCKENLQNLDDERKAKDILEAGIKECLDNFTRRFNQAKEELHDAKQQIASLEVEIEEKTNELSMTNADKVQLEKKLEKINRVVAKDQDVLDKMRAELDGDEERMNRLFKENDPSWVVSELKRIKLSIVQVSEKSEKLEEMIQERECELNILVENESNALIAREELENELVDVNREHERLSLESISLQDSRIKIFNDLTLAQQVDSNLTEQGMRANSHLMARAGESRQLLIGLNSMETMKSSILESGSNLLEGYRGCLADCFDCMPELYTAVSSIAGKRLFFHVVDNKNVANELLKLQKAMKLPGEITFIPLDLVRYYTLKSDTLKALRDVEEGKQLLSLLKPKDEAVIPALAFVYGRFIIVPNLSKVQKLRSILKESVDFVTVDGDQSSRKGVMTGGYYGGCNGSKLAMYRQRSEAAKKLKDHKNTLKEAEKVVQGLDAKTNAAMCKVNKNLAAKEVVSRRLDDAAATLKSIQSDVAFAREGIDVLKNDLKMNNLKLNELRKALGELQTRGSSDGNELEKPEQVAKRLKTKKIEFRDLSKIHNEKKIQALKLNNSIQLGKGRQMDDLEKAIKNKKEVLDGLVEKVGTLKQRIKELKVNGIEQAENLENVQRDVDSLRSKMAKCKKNEENAIRSRDELQSEFEGLKSKHSELAARKQKINELLEEESEKYSGLGIMPSKELYDEAKKLSMSECASYLKKAKAALEKLEGKVNHRALEVFQILQDRRKEFKTRLTAAAKEKETVEDYLESLENSSSQKLGFTYEQVNKYFVEIFNHLAPPGSVGKLSFEKNTSGDICGIAVLVKFGTGREIGSMDDASGTEFSGDFQDMRNLSGGQKTIVALSLIFSFQKCDQSPFYIMDEIDAALDASKRKKLAEFISTSRFGKSKENQEKGVQYITTTFRRELVGSADKLIRVKYANGVSHAEEISVGQANKFFDK